MNSGIHPPETRDPEDLERDIDRTRSSLGRTMDELENRLSPGQLVDQALSMGRQHGGEFAANLGRSVENHPLPLLLTAVGIAWMMMSSNESRPPRRAAYSPSGGRLEDAKDRLETAKERLHGGMESARSAASAVGDSASRARHAIGDSVSHTGERVRYAGERMRMQGDRVREGFGRMLDEQPLLVGAIGIAIGAALGAILPRTASEDRLMGDTSDSAARRLKERATEAYEDVRDRASEMMPELEEAVTGRTGAGEEPVGMPQHAASDAEIRRDH